MAHDPVIVSYPTWAAYRAALAEIPADVSVGGSDVSWAKSRDVGDALRIADKGWPEGMDRVRSIALPAVSTAVQAHVQDDAWRYDVTGADYDVGEYVSGAPECWLDRSAEATRPVITIGANIVSSGGIPSKVLEMRGAAVCALTLALQAAGYVVRLYAVEGMSIGRDIWHRVEVTDPEGGPLDVDRMLYAIAHPSAARQLGYALGAHLAGRNGTNCGIGWPGSGPGQLPPAEWKFDLYMGGSYLDSANWNDAASVNAWIAETYKALTEGRSIN
jgi:hypothetical protein